MDTEALFEELEAAQTCYAATCALLRAWRDRPFNHPRGFDAADDSYVAWSNAVELSKDWFAYRRDGNFLPADRKKVRQWIRASNGDPNVIHAVGWGLDLSAWPTFAEAWESETAGETGTFAIRPADLYPVGDIDPRILPEGTRLSTRPSGLGVDTGEFPHVRVQRASAEEDAIEVTFDFRSAIPLEAVFRSLRVATVHPNADLEQEFEVPDGPLVFPIGTGYARQFEVVHEGCQIALDHDSTLVVVPELTVRPDILARLQGWLDEQWTAACIVAGSSHVTVDGQPSNVSTALLPDYPALTHRKLEACTDHVSGRPPSREGISPAPRRITIHVAGRFRFAFVICKDLLDSAVFQSLVRAGVNVLAVPAMSPTTDDYRYRVGEFVGATQGVVVVANNPTSYSRTGDPLALLGQPVASRRVVEVPGGHVGEVTPRGVAVFPLAGRTRWWGIDGH